MGWDDMVTGLVIATVGLMLSQALIGAGFLVSCIWERERRAAVFAALLFLAILGLACVVVYLWRISFFQRTAGAALLLGVLVLNLGALFLLTKKRPPNAAALKGCAALVRETVSRVDERMIVFARNRSLRPGSDQYRRFYAEHPELEAVDHRRRLRGGPLGRPGAIDRPLEKPNVSASLAALSIPVHLSAAEKVQPRAHPEMAGRGVAISPGEASERVKGYAQALGADLVGVARLDPRWLYSHRGEIFHANWDDWGKEIRVSHSYAVVFAVEMSFPMTATAPHTPTVVESMRNYSRGAHIACQLAAYIANLGHSATANHLRHYDGVLVPWAVEAGLGEVGRLGYLITREYGPRIRLGAVTTDMPLIPDKPVDAGIEYFCGICRKCADCCPSNSIPTGERTVVNGTLRWKLNAETCFDYWGKVGTDCNICMRVCPWSHPRTLPHRLIVTLVSRNVLSARFFFRLDQLFYGKRPRPKQAPKWASFHS